MKIEAGMYVRTKHRNEVVIRKIVNIYEDSKEHDHILVFDKPTKYQYYIEDNNFNASFDLNILLDKGDIILYDDLSIPFSFEIIRDIHNSVMLERIKSGEIKIKQILTKEEFDKRKYVIGDD